LQRIRRDRPDLRDSPFAVTRPVANKGSKVAACCERASAHGIRTGMVLAEALAMWPRLTCVEEDVDADRRVLIELAAWAQRYSPIVGLEDAIAPTCLYLDVTGGTDCFGGEEALVRKARDEFRANGWTVTIALADTIGAAWAHGRDEGRGARDENDCYSFLAPRPSPLAPLPVAALRLSPATVDLLAQLGIERVGQLMALPRDQIAERFGPEVGLRLDQATGRVAEVIVPLHPQLDATASWAFDDPIDRHVIVVKVLDILLQRLQTILEIRRCGVRLVECVFELEDAAAQRFECSLSRPAQTASYLSGLLRTRLEQIRVAAPIRAMCVRAAVLERMPQEQPSLFEREADEGALAQLLDSLASRLGRDVVTRARFVAEPQPELACCFDSALQPGKPSIEDAPLFGHRPLRLFGRPIAIQGRALPWEGEAPAEPGNQARQEPRPPKLSDYSIPGTPQRFQHAGTDHLVVRCQGPERIETGWWRGDDVQRDYFLVETAQGTRWWIFQRLQDGRWFLHGCFD
jgi:protein ImuB